jgi:hypothetical protein
MPAPSGCLFVGPEKVGHHSCDLTLLFRSLSRDILRSLLEFRRVTSLTLADSTRLWYGFAGSYFLYPMPHSFFDLERRDPSNSISRIPAGRLLHTYSNFLKVPPIFEVPRAKSGPPW